MFEDIVEEAVMLRAHVLVLSDGSKESVVSCRFFVSTEVILLMGSKCGKWAGLWVNHLTDWRRTCALIAGGVDSCQLIEILLSNDDFVITEGRRSVNAWGQFDPLISGGSFSLRTLDEIAGQIRLRI
jgi:hypothetical protein